MRTVLLEMNEINPEAAARLTYAARQRSPLRSDGRTVEKLTSVFELQKSEAKDHVLTVAYGDSDELVGMLQIWTGLPGMGVALPWQPIVHPDRDADEIAVSLIERAKDLAHTHSRTRLEIWMGLDSTGAKEIRPDYVRWYETAGFCSVGSEYHMRASMSELSTKEASFPEHIEVLRLDDVTNEKILEPVMMAFRASQDSWFATLSRTQQEGVILANWLNREEVDGKDSVVLSRRGKVVGFTAIRMHGDLAEVGPVGVIPDYRGKGLARAMLLKVIGSLRAKGVENAYIEVNTANAPAERLYLQLGFRKMYDTLLYSWGH